MIAQTRPLGEQYNDGYLKSPVLAPAARVDNSHAVSDTVVDVELVEIGTGVATFYGPHFTEGMTTRGGRPYHPDAQIVAVPLELYDELVGEQVKVTNMETSRIRISPKEVIKLRSNSPRKGKKQIQPITIPNIPIETATISTDKKKLIPNNL